MIGISTDAYQILFPGPLNWELWLVRNGESSLLSTGVAEGVLDFDPSLRVLRVLAQPTTFQVAMPFVSSAMDSATLVQSAQLHVEKQGHGFDDLGIMVETIYGSPPRTVARIDAPYAKLNRSGVAISTPDVIVPAATTMPLRKNSIAIWNELGNAVVAFERDGAVIYYDKLGGAVGDFPDEIHRMIMQLEGGRLINPPELLCIWGDNPGWKFDDKFHIATSCEPRPSPTCVTGVSTLRPLWYREDELRRRVNGRKKRRLLASALILGLCVFATSVYLLTRLIQVSDLNRQIELLTPEVARIESIRSRWNEVAPGIDPDSSILETWMHIFNLKSISGIKIENLSINGSEIVILGNSTVASLALEFIEELVSSDTFNAYHWEYSPPEMSSGGYARFEIKGVK
jgi:hypothetical protein